MDINPPWLGNHNGPDPLNNRWFIHHQNRGCCCFFSVSNRYIVNHPKQNGISESPWFFADFHGKDTWIMVITMIFRWFGWFFCGIFYRFGVSRLTLRDEMTRLTSSLCLRSVSGLHTMSVSPMTSVGSRREQSLGTFQDCWVEYMD